MINIIFLYESFLQILIRNLINTVPPDGFYVEVIKDNWFKIFQAPIRKDQLDFAHLSSYNR